MIKYFCDRCGKEMENANRITENVMIQFNGDACAREVFNGTIEGRLFCDKCKDDLKAWLNVERRTDGNE